MTEIRLPTEPVKLPEFDCDPALIEGFAADLLAASAQVDDLGTFVAGSARVPTWIGSDADQYRTGITALGTRADAMSLALRGVSQRVSLHATRMTTYETTYSDLKERRLQLSIAIAEVKGLAATATEDQVAEIQGKCDTLNTRSVEFNTDASDFVTDVSEEESAMVAAFGEMQTRDQVMKRYEGVPDPADGALASKPGPDASPSAVNAWWEGLTEEQRQAIIAASPGSIGNLDGIPAADRDAANTVALNRDLAALRLLEERGVLTDSEKEHLVNAEAAEKGLENIREQFDPVTGEPILAQLYIYDPLAFDGDGRVAIAAGDIDTADNVSVVVPGLTNDGGSIPGQATNAADIYTAARYDDPSQTNATLAWMGYDAPDSVPWEGDGQGGWDFAGVVKEDMAERGGERLADTVDGIRAIREGDQPHLTAVGHSYGSTTTGHAATDHGLDVDDIVLVGSPGPGDAAEHATDLGVGSDHVWVGTNSLDPVGGLGDKGWINKGNIELGLGRDPAEDDFGAIRFQAEATDRGTSLDPFDDHSKYFDPNTESLHNIAEIINGHYDDVTRAEHKYDPWYDSPRDPEIWRYPTAPKTEP